MSLTVYSCVVGAINDSITHLLDIRPAPGDIRYVLFTDQAEPQIFRGAAVTWEIRKPIWKHGKSRRTARYHKLNSHLVLPDAELSIWFDGSLTLQPDTDLQALANQHLQSVDIATFQHGDRDCIYQEYAACVRLGKDSEAVMWQQITRYRGLAYPSHNGLVETGALFRRHTPQVAAFNQEWWNEVRKGSLRDQLSFNFVAWRLGMPFGTIGQRSTTPQFTFHKH